MRNLTKRSDRQSFDQLYDENLLSDRINLFDDSFLSLVDEESDSDSADDIPFSLILNMLREIAPFVKPSAMVVKTLVGEYRKQRKENGLSREAAARKAAKKAGLISNGNTDESSDSFNDLSDTLYGLLHEEDSLIQEYKKYKGKSFQGELPKIPIKTAPEVVRKAISSGKPRSGVYVFFKNGSRVYVGRSKNLPVRLSQHRLCFRKFQIDSSGYTVKVYFFKNFGKHLLPHVERLYRKKYPIKLGHLKNDFDYFL